jgi:hypothetical protein
MKKLAKIVSDGITGESKVILIRDRFYRVAPPSPYVLGRMLIPLSHLSVEDGESKSALIQKNVKQYRFMDEVIATAILGDAAMTPAVRFRLWRMKRRFRRASDIERLKTFNEIISIIIPDVFFLYARLAMELTGRLSTEPSAGER